MSENKNSWNNDFWSYLNNYHRFDKLSNLKSFIITLVFLKHISDNKNTNTGLHYIIPEDCDFQSILKLCDALRPSFGDEINRRLNCIAKENPIFDGVINFVDFNNSSVLGEDYESDIILGNIIRLIDDYSHNHASLDNNNKTIWIDLFDFLKQSFVEHNRKSIGIVSTPNEAGVLIAKLMDLQKGNGVKSIYDPICGTGNLLFSVFNELDAEVNLYGEEINRENVYLAKLTFLIHGITNFELKTGDVLNFPTFVDLSMEETTFFQPTLTKFDYIVSNPPFNVKNWYKDPLGDMYDRWNSKTGIPSDNNADFAYILHIINSLKVNGIAACVIPPGVLFRGGQDRKIRQYLVDNHFIKGIIGLPAKLFNNTGIQTSIMILGNQPNDNRNEIFMIDASSEFLEGRFLNKLSPENINHIANVWKLRKEVNEFSRIVSFNEIVENDYNLSISRYLVNIEAIEVPADSKLVELSSLLSSITKIKSKDDFGKLVKIADLSEDGFLYTIPIEKLSEGDVNRTFNKISSPVLLISKRFNKLKPSFCNASIDNPIFVSPDIEAFTIINDSIDLSYLILQLNSDFVTKQIESYSIGSIMTSLKKEDILKLKVIIPNAEAQNLIALQKALAEGARIQSDKSKIETLQLQTTIDSLLKERMNDFQWKLHDIRNGELLNLKGQIVTLEFFADANPNLFNKVIDEESNTTVLSSIKDIYTSVQKLAMILSDLYDSSENIGQKEEIDILEFIKAFSVNQLNLNKNLFEIDYSDVDKVKEDFGLADLIISVNKKDLYAVFTNIFENAIRHGGFSESNQTNKFKIEVSLDTKKGIVSIAVLNNGKASKIDELDYFADGGKAGLTSNSGKGGHIIKVLTERNNGKAFQNNYTIEETGGYTFEVGVQFNYKLFYEL